MSETMQLRAEAERLYADGDTDGALERYRRLLREEPENTDLLSDAGTVCFAAGRAEQSRRYYLRALALEPDHPEATANLAELCRAQGWSYEALLAEAADERAVTGSAGELERLYREGRYADACKLARVWTETEPDNPEAWNDAAVCAHRLGRSAEAVGYAQRAAELAPENQQVAENLAEILDCARASTAEAPTANVGCPPATERPLRVLFLEPHTPDAFLKNLLRALQREEWLQIHHEEFTPQTGSLAIEWADVVWLEWANELAVFATRQLSALQSRPVVCRLHRYEAFSDLPRRINWDVVDCLVFVAEHVRRAFGERFPEVSVEKRVIHNGVDLDRFTIAPDKEQTRDIAFLAHLNWRKNLPLVFQIAHGLQAAGGVEKFHVAGDWQVPELREYFHHMRREMGLEETVVHDGYIEDVPAWLADKRHLLSASVNEGHPCTVLEAMAAGLRPVVHNFPGAAELFPDECLFNTVAEAVYMLDAPAGEPERYRDYVQDSYPRDRQLRKIRQLLEDLVGGDWGPSESLEAEAEVLGPSARADEELARTYDENWYRERIRYRPAYHEFARAVDEVLAPRSLADLGCGAGFIVEHFADKVPVLGVEGSREAFQVMSPKARSNAVCADLTGPPLPRLKQFESVVCMEVAEHIPEERVEDFLAWFTAARQVLLTAAPPGQGGNHHVNEQPPEYWQELFANIGLRYDPQRTSRWRALARAGTRQCSWVVRNAMLFSRGDAA